MPDITYGTIADWIPLGEQDETWLWIGKCSNCGAEVYPRNYCHNCGARLNIPEDIEHAPIEHEDIKELIAHVGYDEAQCGYDK